MAIERVRAYFRERGIEDRIREYDVSAATVELAAGVAGCEPARIAKSLSFVVDGAVILVVMAGDTKVDNRSFKQQFGAKPRMLAADEAEERIGHAVGGICPFAVNDEVKIYLDEALRRFDTVFPACGSSNSLIELTLPELESLSQSSSWVRVSKPADQAVVKGNC